jgi:hypothetical protein
MAVSRMIDKGNSVKPTISLSGLKKSLATKKAAAKVAAPVEFTAQDLRTNSTPKNPSADKAAKDFGRGVGNFLVGENITRGLETGDFSKVNAGDAGLLALNFLPVGGAVAAVKGAKAAAKSQSLARAFAVQAARNPLVQTRQPVGVLEQMARSGDTRFRNVFEVDPKDVARYDVAKNKGFGTLDDAARSEDLIQRRTMEEKVLGIPFDAPGSARPIYGTVTPRIPFLASSAPKPFGTASNAAVPQMRDMLSVNNTFLESFAPSGASVIFDPKKLSNASITAGDTGASLLGGARGGAANLGTTGATKVAKDTIVDYKGMASTSPFMEAQMYGANLANAKKVLVPTKESQAALRKIFKEQDIKVPVYLNRGMQKQNARQAAIQKRNAEAERKRDLAWEDRRL